MNRPLSAIVGGVAGTTVMFVLLFLLEVQTRSQIELFAVIARFVGVPGEIFLGFVVFFVVGSVVWPLLFVAVEGYVPRPDPAARGAAFAVALWVVFVVTGRGDIGGPILVLYATFTLLAHLAYGFVLGAVYGRLATTTRVARTPDPPTG